MILGLMRSDPLDHLIDGEERIRRPILLRSIQHVFSPFTAENTLRMVPIVSY